MRRSWTRVTVIHLLAWLTIAFVGLVAISQALAWSGTSLVAIAQSLTPYLAASLVPVIVLALWHRHLLMATVATSIAAVLWVLGAPLVIPDPQPPTAVGSTGLEIASLNLLYHNEQIADVDETLADLHADVIVFSEYTASHQRVLEASALADDYAYRTERIRPGGIGVAVWSRWPLRIGDALDTFHESLTVTITGPDGDIDIVAMHMPTPLVDADAWRTDLATAAGVGRRADGPTLLIGDLNSSYWHPDFRRLLDAGFVDAHDAAGSGFSTSWPTDRWIPPFVRLDHALTTGGLVSTGVRDFDIPGGDHLGLVVTVAPARRAMP